MRTRLLILVLVAVTCLAGKPLPVVFQKSGPVKTARMVLPGVRPGNQYSILYSLNSLSGIAADGRAPLAATYAFDVNGVLQFTYSETETKQGPQIALASFTSDDALQMIGGRLVAASSVQEHVFGHAGTGVFGTITGGSLEQSDVDLTQEFAQMIIIQRGYQASSKVMTVSNQMLEELYNGQSGG